MTTKAENIHEPTAAEKAAARTAAKHDSGKEGNVLDKLHAAEESTKGKTPETPEALASDAKSRIDEVKVSAGTASAQASVQHAIAKLTQPELSEVDTVAAEAYANQQKANIDVGVASSVAQQADGDAAEVLREANRIGNLQAAEANRASDLAAPTRRVVNTTGIAYPSLQPRSVEKPRLSKKAQAEVDAGKAAVADRA